MLPRVLKNFNLFLDGIGYAGRIDEVEPPDLKIKTEEHRAGGMDGSREIDMGMEALSAKFTFSEYLVDVLTRFGDLDPDAVRAIIKGSLKRDGEKSVAISIELHGGFKSNVFGSWKAGDLSKLEAEFAVSYYKLTIGGTVIHEIDIDNMIRVIGGVDRLADIRADIGL